MRNRIVPLLILVIVGANLRADPIRYDQIPSDAMSYIHFDADRFLSCRALAQFGAPADLAAKAQAALGGKLTSFTVYFFEDSGAVQTVILVHGDAALSAAIQAHAGKARDKIVFKYQDQEIFYSSEGLLAEAPWAMASLGQDQKAEPEQKGGGIFGGHGSFSLGVGTKPSASDVEALASGPSYRAFVGPDLFVMTTDIRSISKALDTLRGNKASLAKEDPRGLKGEIPAGAIFMGAGLTAQVSGDNTTAGAKQSNSATRPANVARAGGIGLDMFASFKGRAELARFAIGEDAQSDYIDASITMTDGQFAEQLKNLIIGIKALVSLSQAKQAPLIEPLQIRANGKEVGLHWSWPTAKLSELIRLADNDGDGNAPTTIPHSNGGR